MNELYIPHLLFIFINMDESVKKWRDNNTDKVKLQKKREKIRKILRDNGILPKIGIEPNDEQTLILEQISNNDFSFYTNYKIEKKKQTKTYKKRIHKESERPILKKSRLTYELRQVGILPELGEQLTEEQEMVIKSIDSDYEQPIKSFITKYRHLISPEYSIWYRIKQAVYKSKKRRHTENPFDVSVNDIHIPKYCPYLNIKLSTDISDSHTPFYYTIDRIDSSKGYIKGNIQVISKLANTMKNNATIDELLVFSENVIRLHKSQIL
jgi:hypothetical protein